MNTPTDCTPSAPQRRSDSLAAPAAVGQGVCTGYLSRLRRASSLIARISALRCSCSALTRRFSWTTRYAQIALITATAPAIAQTKFTIESTEEPLWLFALLLVLADLLAVVIFHWVLEPLHRWIVEKLS